MNKPVLFATGLGKEFERAENIKVLFDAYPGPKECISTHDNRNFYSEVKSGKYDLLVIDVFPTLAPLRCIMNWHAIQGGKLMGMDDRKSYYRPIHGKLIDYIVASGHGAVPLMSRCTLVPEEKILPLGMARTDRYIGKNKGDGGTPLAGKRSYLYVPTFRGWNETEIPQIDWWWLDEQLTDDELLVVKEHPYGFELNLSGYRHIIEVPQMEPSVNYLYDCDVVITDYSSIMFDAYLLGKPCVLFEKNTGYTKMRGMYHRYPEQYSSRYAVNERQLLQHIRTASKLTGVERSLINRMADMCDGHSCERICKLIDDVNGGRK